MKFDIINKIKNIELKIKYLSNELFSGNYRSSFRGSGLEVSSSRPYEFGDEVRFIDWKLSAKSNNTFVKTFEEERNVEIIVVLDITSSMLIGYKKKSKLM